METRYYTLLLLICFGYSSYCQEVTTIAVAGLPKKPDVVGVIKKAYAWKYKDTTHYIIYSEVGLSKTHPDLKDSISGYLNGHPVYNQEYSMTDNEYYFYHYTSHQNVPQLKWKIYDYIKECEFDTRFHFITDAFRVTDLDNNGTNEIWIMYSLSCTSDVSPDSLKLIMYEGSTQYTIRGETRDYEVEPKQKMDSPKTIGTTLQNNNPKFKEYALDLWMEHNIYRR